MRQNPCQALLLTRVHPTTFAARISPSAGEKQTSEKIEFVTKFRQPISDHICFSKDVLNLKLCITFDLYLDVLDNCGNLPGSLDLACKCLNHCSVVTFYQETPVSCLYGRANSILDCSSFSYHDRRMPIVSHSYFEQFACSISQYVAACR